MKDVKQKVESTERLAAFWMFQEKYYANESQNLKSRWVL